MRANETRGTKTGNETMNAARQHVANFNRASRISRLAKGLCYEIDFASCPGFWFIRIDGRSYSIGHDGTQDADMASKAMAWVAKQSS